MSHNLGKQRRGPRRVAGNGPMSRMPVEKAKDFKSTLSKLIKYLRSYQISILIVVLSAVASSIFTIVGPKILGNATTEIFNGVMESIQGTGGIDFNSLGETLLLLLGLYIISALFGYLRGFVVSKLSSDIAYELRSKITDKLNRLPMSFFDKNTTGDILSRVTNDVDTINTNLTQILDKVIASIALLIGVIVMMLSINVTMTLAVVLILPLSLGMMGFIMKKSQKHFKTQRKFIGDINAQIEENFGGHTVVKAFNGEQMAIETFKDSNDILEQSAWKSQFYSGLMMPLMTFIGNLGYVLVTIFGGYLASRGTIQVGDIVSFTQYARTFMQPLGQIAQIGNYIQATIAAAERVFEVLDAKEEDMSFTYKEDINELEGQIDFDHVNFGYLKDQTIIKDFCLEVNEGQKIAIVGPTGAGKTTIVKLLMHFYDINSGSIKIDGVDIKDIKRSSLRNLFGIVLQNPWLFNGTIYDNIKYGSETASHDQVLNASKAAHADHFIKTLSEGYETIINEEADNISEGQKQLLTIARVILNDPKILILDEATSSVDTRTEVLIQKAMDKLMENRTSFIIAHRLSTIKNADVILVLNEGNIVEQGDHNTLLEKGGFYSKLYNSQFEM